MALRDGYDLRESIELLDKTTINKEGRNTILRINMSYRTNTKRAKLFLQMLEVLITALKFNAKDVSIWSSIKSEHLKGGSCE